MSDDKSDLLQVNADLAGTATEMQGDVADAAAQSSAELEALIVENAEMRDRLLRTLADMENLSRRTEREKADTARYAISNFARDVLSVGDNLKRTIDHVLAKAQDAEAQDSALKSFLEGVELTERELLKVLERHDVSRSEPLGEHFDPNCHQAMYEVHDSNVADGTVVDVMQAGYVIGDRCLRPALVAVAKGRAKANVPEQGEEGSQSPPMTTAPTVDTRDKPE